MIKIPIKKIEEVTKGSIRKNALALGFDVAEHYTGICLLRTDNNSIFIDDLNKIETNPKEDTVHRMEKFMYSLDKYKQGIKETKNFKIVIIEDCWFGRNVETLKHLARFSALVYVAFKEFSNNLFFILPNSARAKIKFKQKEQEKVSKIKGKIITRGKNKGTAKKINIKDLVKEYLEMYFGITIKDSDQADAFVLAIAGLLA